jgi:hypothetical protein
VFNPRAITCNVIIPTSRFPNSMSDMCPLFMSRLTAISVCVQPFCRRWVRMRFPNCTRSAWLPLDMLSSSAYYFVTVSGMPDIDELA